MGNSAVASEVREAADEIERLRGQLENVQRAVDVPPSRVVERTDIPEYEYRVKNGVGEVVAGSRSAYRLAEWIDDVAGARRVVNRLLDEDAEYELKEGPYVIERRLAVPMSTWEDVR